MRENARRPREIDTRETDAREEYKPPSALPDPIADPAYQYHWVATHVLGKTDPSNMSKKRSEGWEPCRAEDHPELSYLATEGGNIEIGGLMLCRMPKSRYQARQRYYDRQAQQQMLAVDNNFMRENDPRMPLFKEHKSSTTRGGSFGNGS